MTTKRLKTVFDFLCQLGLWVIVLAIAGMAIFALVWFLSLPAGQIFGFSLSALFFYMALNALGKAFDCFDRF